MDTSDQQQQRAAPRLVKAREADDGALAAFSPEQRAQLRAWLDDERADERAAWRDIAQGLGAVVAALRRLAGMGSLKDSRG